MCVIYAKLILLAPQSDEVTRILSTATCAKIFLWHRLDPVLSKSESVKFLLIEPVIYLFTDSLVQKYFSLSNQLIFAV